MKEISEYLKNKIEKLQISIQQNSEDLLAVDASQMS